VIVATADSNIYISALNFGGVPRQLLNAARVGAFRLAVSSAIIEEIRGVLHLKFRWDDQELDEIIGSLGRVAQLVEPTQSLTVIRDDPDDDKILECAVSSDSQFVISGDKHLLQLGQYQQIRIVTAAEFMTLIPQPPK
jgi:uncharacterized protein